MQQLDIFAWKQQWRNGFFWGGLIGWMAGILIVCLGMVTTPDENNPAYHRGKADGLHEAKQMLQPLLDRINDKQKQVSDGEK